MEQGTTFWSIGTAFFAVLGVYLSLRLIWKSYFRFGKEKEYISNYTDRGDHFEEELLRQGYVFCTLFRVSDIVSIARKMGISLTMDQVVRIVQSVKKDFKLETGIDAHKIQMHIRIVIKHLTKQTPI